MDEAAFLFQAGLVHEAYALFKVLSPVKRGEKKKHKVKKKIHEKGAGSSEAGVALVLANP